MNNNTAQNVPDPLWLTWLVGQRVVVRKKLPSGSPHLYTDVKGTVVKTDASGVTLQTQTETVTIAALEIAIGKMIPPRPAPRRPRS
ncbi:hypothetical protein V5R04_03365 [Jonesiaceae bacterium BS-20]|uniref:Histone acetyltransferase Rv0428c-like SH3 domain-containing protein n=1 Tax=Jonesiaceae bacterium BS-20 TaxID=3120821 RepID=A0AAU7DYD0_9MICO